MLHSVPKGAAAAQARAMLAAGVWAGSRGGEQGERALGGFGGGSGPGGLVPSLGPAQDSSVLCTDKPRPGSTEQGA